MILSSPGSAPVPVTSRGSIEAVIAALPGHPEGDQFAILGPSDQTYIQTLLTPDGFVLQYQEGSTEHHFETDRGDLSSAEVVEAFSAYLERNPAWKFPFSWHRVEVRTGSYRLGAWIGGLVGRLLKRPVT